MYFSFADLLLVFLTCDFLTCGCSTFGFFDLWIVRPFFHAKIFTCRFDWFFTCGSFYLLVFYLWIVPIFTSEYFICVFFSCGSLLGFATEPQLVICKVHSSKLNVATST